MNEPCLCGNAQYQKIYGGTYVRGEEGSYDFALQKCRKCSLVRTDPIPDITFYETGYQVDEAGQYLVRLKPWDAKIAKHLKKILECHPKVRDRPALDVGCNGGELVEQLKLRGIEAEGCDVDRVAIAHGAGRGLPLFCRDLAHEKLDKPYGAVTMIHTLEHIVPAPQMLEHIAGALDEGGLLYIRVPNFGGWIPRLMKGGWAFLVPAQHVWQFTPQTLKHHVERITGLRALEISCRSRMEPPSPGLKGAVKEFIAAQATHHNQGDEIVALFKKP